MLGHTRWFGGIWSHTIIIVRLSATPAGLGAPTSHESGGRIRSFDMDPSAPNFDSLRAQLIDDAVAFDTGNPANLALEADLLGAVADVNAGEAGPAGPVGIVVLGQAGQPAGALRDLAQDLKDATATEAGFDTVIVRSPAATAAVSDSLTRAQVEKGQYALISEPNYAAGVRAFAAEADAFTIPWALVTAILLVLVAVAAGVSFFFSKSND